VLAVDGSAFYYGDLQVDPLDVSHNRRVFPERIRQANGRAAFGSGKYYDPATGDLLGSLGFATSVYAPNRSGDDFWAYDPTSETLRHFFASDGPLPTGPKANADLARTGKEEAIDVDVLANDLGFEDPVTVTIATPPSNGSVTVTGSPGTQAGVRLRYAPGQGFVGSDSLVYTVSDGTNTDSANVAITVDAFRARADSYIVPRNVGSTALYVARNDVGFSNPVTLTITNAPTGGSAYASSSPGNAQNVYISYYPSYSASGGDYLDSFSYQISDGTHTDSATVAVEVVAFRAVADSATTAMGFPVGINVTQNDIGASYGVTVGLFESPRHGSVTSGGGSTLIYTPDAGFIGADAFIYAIDDGQHVSFGTVTVFVIQDADRDGVPDDADNCMLVANPDQRNSDGDA
jgi:hypothetical protein